MRKGKIFISIVLIMAMIFVNSYSAVALGDYEDSLDMDRYIKVGLYWGTNSVDSVTLSCDDGFILYDADGDVIEEIDETTLNIDVSSDYLEHKKGRIFMSAAEDPDDRIVTLKAKGVSKQYRDGIWLYENSGLRVINFVTLEHYVWGVVSREMSSSYPLEALKAQAIAARTYALYIRAHASKHTAYGFDVCATTDCQAYGAVASESDKTTQACYETEDLIMTYDGEPIYALFSACSGGGYTSSIYDAWGIDLDQHPYLASVPDMYSPEYHWETDYKFTTIRQRLIDNLGLDIGEVSKVEISDTNSFGAVTGILITGSNGTKRVPRSQIMSVFNLKSNFFCIGDDDYNEINICESTPDTYFVLSADGVEEVDTSDIYVYDGTSIERMKVQQYATYEMENDVCEDGMVYMRGLGYGHGIGLSQLGAKAMANDYGMDYSEILNYYYSGIDIESY